MRQPLLALGALLAAALPATATAAPVNDNYLASTTITSVDFQDNVDTSTATTQPDILNPDRNGQQLGGGPPEITTCNGTPFGNTVWYDFQPPTWGGVEIDTAGTFDNVVAVYRWDPKTSLITSTLRCANDSPALTEKLLLQSTIKPHAHYTIQVGGVGAAGGPLNFHFTYFPDSDGDGVLDDEPDSCPHEKGTIGGCPPVVRAAPSISFNRVGGGLQITSISVDHVLKRGRVEVRCRHCGRAVRARARRAGSLKLRGFVGRTLRPGDYIEVRATQPRAKKGRLKFGAIGRSFRYPVTSKGLGHRIDHCLRPGSSSKVQRCP